MTCEGISLENVDSYKYLGVWISKNGKFNQNKNSLCLQAKKVVFGIKRIIGELKSPPVQISLHLYDRIVKPLLCYRCELWGFENDRDIERVKLDYMKLVYST